MAPANEVLLILLAPCGASEVVSPAPYKKFVKLTKKKTFAGLNQHSAILFVYFDVRFTGLPLGKIFLRHLSSASGGADHDASLSLNGAQLRVRALMCA